jgi:heme-degrading monooxygenase HmoA
LAYRALMIRKMDPSHAPRVAELFAAHDRTDLPLELGATRRTLFSYHDLYLHLIEAEDGFRERLFAAAGRKEFAAIDAPLAGLLTPYLPDEPTMGQAQASPFYTWEAPLASELPPATRAPGTVGTVVATVTDPVFRFVLELRVHPGKHEEFRSIWAQMATAAARHPCNLDQLLTQRLDDEDIFEITSDWTEPSAYREFSSSSAHDELAARIRACTSGASLRSSRHVLSARHTPSAPNVPRSEKAALR